jgi:hypothetical protein
MNLKVILPAIRRRANLTQVTLIGGGSELIEVPLGGLPARASGTYLSSRGDAVLPKEAGRAWPSSPLGRAARTEGPRVGLTLRPGPFWAIAQQFLPSTASLLALRATQIPEAFSQRKYTRHP